MSSSTTVRRKLNVATATPSDAKTAATINGSSTTTTEAKAMEPEQEEQEDEDNIQGTEQPADRPYVAPTLAKDYPQIEEVFNTAADDIQEFRNEIELNEKALAFLVRNNWTLALSKETVYALGEMRGHYAMLLFLLQRDVEAAGQE